MQESRREFSPEPVCSALSGAFWIVPVIGKNFVTGDSAGILVIS
jgi:hypothetical protein